MAKITKQYLDFNGLNLYNEYIFSKIKQSDWSVNDPSDPRYVKNRTHWIGDPVETVLIPEQTVAFEVSGEMGEAVSPVTIEPVEGQSYTVNFDGVTYQCVCKMFGGTYLYIGSPTIFELEDTGEPFIYLYYNGQGMWGAYNADTEHVVSVSITAVHIVPIDDKFIPDTIARISNSEEWVFTLEDGSTVTKKVVLG